MELDPKDHDVARLLTELKNYNESYPPDLLLSRRENYLRRITEFRPGSGSAAESNATGKSSGKGSGLSTKIAGGLIEAALIAAIVTEAGSAAYIYRDRIAEFFQSYTSKPQIVEDITISTPETEFSPKLPIVVITDTEEASAISPAVETLSPTPFATTSAANNNQDNQGNQAIETPDPNGNNGNHFGQTLQPERTKDSGGINDAGKDNGGDSDTDNNEDKGKDKDN